jgi:uncharacterized membrane protein/protein-disulfide isomerase
MAPRTRWLIVAFSLIGLAFAGAAAYVHYRLLTEPAYVSPCDINARFNCSEVYLSRFGSIGGVPVALGGILWFAAVALLAMFSTPADKPAEDATGAYIFALATVGLAAVLYFAWASFFVLKTGCILCMGTYASVIAIFIVSGTAACMKMSSLPGRLARDLRALITEPLRLVATLLFVAAAVSMVGCFPKEGKSAAASTVSPAASTPADAASAVNAQKSFDDLWAAQPRVDLGIPADGAQVVVVKFNDWQCPSCKASYYAYKPILDKYLKESPGTVKYITKDYPLSVKCNFNIGGENHSAACEAAAAVRIARRLGKEDEMVTWLFSNQATLMPNTVTAEVKKLLGVDLAKEYPALLPDIKRDAADGGALKVEYTPTYYVNGVKAQLPDGGWLQPQYFDYAIQYELKRAAQTSASRSSGK